MHYRVQDLVVRSENAAKPMSQSCAGVVRWLRSRDRTESALDYGCGKLRYTRHLAHRSKRFALVDSKIQLTRLQRIDGSLTTVLDYAKANWPSCRSYEIEEFWRGTAERYGFVLCANVLSAIPSLRLRERSLKAIRHCLEPGGRLLVVNQHTNSYFGQARRRPGTVAHLDGWLLPSRHGAAYYGLLNKGATVEILCRSGFSVEDAWVDGQSNYVVAKA